MPYLLQLCPLLWFSSSSVESQNIEVNVNLGVSEDSGLSLLCSLALKAWVTGPRGQGTAAMQVGFINFMNDVEGHHDTW